MTQKLVLYSFQLNEKGCEEDWSNVTFDEGLSSGYREQYGIVKVFRSVHTVPYPVRLVISPRCSTGGVVLLK